MKILKLKVNIVKIGKVLDYEYNSPSGKEKGKPFLVKSDLCLEGLVVYFVALSFHLNCTQE